MAGERAEELHIKKRVRRGGKKATSSKSKGGLKQRISKRDKEQTRRGSTIPEQL